MNIDKLKKQLFGMFKTYTSDASWGTYKKASDAYRLMLKVIDLESEKIEKTPENTRLYDLFNPLLGTHIRNDYYLASLTRLIADKEKRKQISRNLKKIESRKKLKSKNLKPKQLSMFGD